MPVLRMRETVRANFGLNPVASSANPMPAVLRQTGTMLAQRAADYARGLAVSAEQEGRALAKAAVFSQDANGIPQLPPNATARMGEIARRSYDSTMEDRYVQQFGIAMGARLQDAHNRNLYDTAGFGAEADQILADSLSTVPDGMQGMVTDMWAGQTTGIGADIGRSTAMADQENARGLEGKVQADNLAVVNQFIIGGKDPAFVSSVIDAEASRIMSLPMGVLNEGQKAAAIENLYYNAGVFRLLNDQNVDVEHASAAQLQDLAAKLTTGKDPAVLGFFLRPGSTAPDMDMAARAANYVQQLIGVANQRDTAAAKAANQAARVNEVMLGGQDDTAESREALDLGISNGIALGGGGTYRMIQPADWGAMDTQTRATAMQAVKGAGFVPASLRVYLKQLDGETDETKLAAGLMVIRDLKVQQSANNSFVDLSGSLTPRMEAIYARFDAEHGGGTKFDTGVRQAAQDAVTVQTMIDNKQWDDARLASRMAEGNWFLNSDPATAKAGLAEHIDDLFSDLGVTPTVEERKAAAVTYETRLMLGDSLEIADGGVNAAFRYRYNESVAMGGARTAYAPEVQFPDKVSQTWTETFETALTSVDGSWSAFKQGLVNAPNAVIPNFLYSYNYGNGTDWMRRPVVEQIANSHIAAMIKKTGNLQLMGLIQNGGTGADGSTNKGAPRFLMPGSDYLLQQQGFNATGKPNYVVILRRPGMANVRLPGVLNMGAEYAQYMDLRATVQQQAAATKARADAVALEAARLKANQEFEARNPAMGGAAGVSRPGGF